MSLIFSSKFDYERAKNWISNMESTAFNLSLLYIISIFSIKYTLQNRKALNLKWPLVLWNAFLAIFSVTGFVRITPVFIQQIKQQGVISSFFIALFIPFNTLFILK